MLRTAGIPWSNLCTPLIETAWWGRLWYPWSTPWCMCHPCISPTSYSPWHQFHSHVLGITPCIGFVKHAHPQHLKVLKHFVYPIWMWDAVNGVCSLNHDTTTSYRLGHTPFPLKFTPPCTCNTAMDASIYTSTASQGIKTFVYIQYGCGMQSMGVCSLNHYTATSYRLSQTPFSLNFTHTSTCNTA